MNIVGLIGRLTADPETKTINGDKAVCNFTVAVKRPRAKDTTDFISCTAWNQPAKFIGQYGKKGSLVSLTGELQQNDYTDANGVKHYGMKVNVQDLSIERSASDGSKEIASAQEPVPAPAPTKSLGELASAFSEVHIADNPFEQEELPF